MLSFGLMALLGTGWVVMLLMWLAMFDREGGSAQRIPVRVDETSILHVPVRIRNRSES